MFKKIENAASCEVRAVIKFLNARNVRPCDIHRQLKEVYGDNVMDESSVRRWCRNFNLGRENTWEFKWETFDHPPYSPDLAPSDFHLFTKLKDFLAGTKFQNDEELKEAVTAYLNTLAAEEYDTGIQKLVTRYDKCLNLFGDYVEK